MLRTYSVGWRERCYFSGGFRNFEKKGGRAPKEGFHSRNSRKNKVFWVSNLEFY
jgi:hypothetical protein